MSMRSFKIDHGWLHFPVGKNSPKVYVTVSCEKKQLAEIHIGITTPEKADFFCPMELESCIGKTVTVSCAENDGLLKGIYEGCSMEKLPQMYPQLYCESFRPQYHFSSRRGWLNDPNGLFYDGEKYHMYYQHNPYGTIHGGVNIHWGHAISDDALYWHELPDAIRPVSSAHHIASGSCIIDEAGIAGYGCGTIIAAYTSLGSLNFHIDPPEDNPSEGQFLAYSTDNGLTFTPFPENPVIPTLNGKSWRDPRLFTISKGIFGIAVYETHENNNCVSFYKSADFHHWQFLSRSYDLFECPDLFRLYAEDGSENWVLYGADGMYRIGRFTENDGFVQTHQKQPLDYGTCTYAGQTWNMPEKLDKNESRLHISWLRDDALSWQETSVYDDMPFSQCMTVPCVLSLKGSGENLRLIRNPISALSNLHAGSSISVNISKTVSAAIPVFTVGDALFEIHAYSPVEISVGNHSFIYFPDTGIAHFSDGKDAYLSKSNIIFLRVLSDRTSCEFFLNDEISASYGMKMDGKRINLTGNFSLNGSMWHMNSIWNEAEKTKE